MRPKLSTQDLTTEYVGALRDYVAHPEDESALQKAYELGRKAMAAGLGLLQITGIQHEALAALLSSTQAQDYENVVRRGAQFFAESLSVFEMAHRSYWEANVALRELTDQVEQRVQERTESLRLTGEKYRNIFENANEGIYVSGIEGEYLSINPAMARIFGYSSPEEMMEMFSGTGAGKLYVEERRHSELTEQLRRQGSLSKFESRVYRKSGEIIWISENIRLFYGEGGALCVEGVVEDVTTQKMMEQDLARQALYDGLTGLPNRVLFLDRLHHAIERFNRRGGPPFAVLFLDLDRFKRINDAMGHLTGDQVLHQAGMRIQGCIRPDDTAARMGGDEFTVLLQGVKDKPEALAIVERILSELSTPLQIESQQIRVTASIGVALSNQGYEQAQDVLRDADTAMYRARSQGRGRYEVFDTEMQTRATLLQRTADELRRAIDRGEFRLHYQPIVSLLDGRVRLFEALLRWKHPEKGLIPPEDFFPAAEESGTALNIGRWILREACCQMKQWQMQFRLNPLPGITVNVSGSQFRHPDFLSHIAEILAETELTPSGLRLEITEHTLMEDAATSLSHLQQLKEQGVGISIDHFGIGQSSLTDLQLLPVDALKLDSSLTRKMISDPKTFQVLSGISTIALGLGLSLTAEGVETPEQLAKLGELKCAYAQGSFFSGAVDSQTARMFLQMEQFWPQPVK